MKKIALINQRYGEEVNGGSEYYTRILAEQLNKYYDVEVLTTRAVDYLTWDNYYSEGVEVVNGVKVRRFNIVKSRNLRKFNYINRIVHFLKIKPIKLEEWWLKEQGPYSLDCINYIKENKNHYDVFIFVTYLYYLTAKGLKQVSEKSILIPTAHDEFCIYFNIYKRLFHIPKAIIYLTEEEKKFVQNVFKNEEVLNDILGIGVDIPVNINKQNFLEKYNIKGDYIIYAGRIDIGKGCDILFDYFIKYKEKNKNDIKLILLGKKVMDIPIHCDIIYLGFVEEECKFNGINGARALVLPSQFESLSIAVLEAMAMGIPVIVNENSEVLKGHCVKSNGGLYYNNYEKFEICINEILKNTERYNHMCTNAKKYVSKNYQWDVVLKKFENIIEKV